MRLLRLPVNIARQVDPGGPEPLRPQDDAGPGREHLQHPQRRLDPAHVHQLRLHARQRLAKNLDLQEEEPDGSEGGCGGGWKSRSERLHCNGESIPIVKVSHSDTF